MIPAGTPLGAVQVRLGAGPVVGLVAEEGQHVHLGKLEGWWDAPATSGQITQKVNDHGAFPGPAYYGPRVVIAEARIDGFTPADSMAVARKLLTQLEVGTFTDLEVTDEAGALTARVRQEGDPILIRTGNRVVVSLSMLAPDPRRYGPEHTESTGMSASLGGFTLPITLPVATGAVSVSGAITVTNEGDMDSPPVFVVWGPTPAGATITDQTGRELYVPEAVSAGRRLVIDVAARTALLDGVSSRVVAGTWPMLSPGVNQFHFNASTYNANALLSLIYRSAWR